MDSRLPILFVILVGMVGCSYGVTARTVPAGNVYSIHDSKIPGAFTMQIAGMDNCCRKEVRPSGYVCSAHNYPLDGGDALRSSIQNTLSQVFETIAPSEGQGNVIAVSVNRFDATIRFAPGFWTVQAYSTAEIGLDVKAMRNGKAVLSTSVFAERSKDGDGGSFCGDGSQVITEAIAAATREVMERMAERLSNNPALRAPN